MGAKSSPWMRGSRLRRLLELFDQICPGGGKAFVEFSRRLSIAAEALRSIVLDTPPNIGGDLNSVIRAALLGSCEGATAVPAQSWSN